MVVANVDNRMEMRVSGLSVPQREAPISHAEIRY